MKERVWVNFKQLRAKLRFEDVLRHYNVQVQRKGNQHQGPCPLPGHTGSGGSPSFSANLERGIFNCFSCGGGGNILEFAALMAGIDLKDGAAFRKVAVELQTKLCGSNLQEFAANFESERQPGAKTINAPLDFALKDLDAGHPYLEGRGFNKETASYFGIGFCSRGVMKNRIAIPLHSHVGELIGYSGRIVDESTASEQNPVYLFPKNRERGGVGFEFDRSRVIYNAHRIHIPCDDLIIVQGFPSVWWLHQCGFTNVVAIIGDDLADNQSEHIISLVRSGGKVRIMPDGDKDGTRFAQTLLRKLSPHRFVRWIRLGGEDRPSDLSEGKLRERLKL